MNNDGNIITWENINNENKAEHDDVKDKIVECCANSSDDEVPVTFDEVSNYETYSNIVDIGDRVDFGVTDNKEGKVNVD